MVWMGAADVAAGFEITAGAGTGAAEITGVGSVDGCTDDAARGVFWLEKERELVGPAVELGLDDCALPSTGAAASANALGC